MSVRSLQKKGSLCYTRPSEEKLNEPHTIYSEKVNEEKNIFLLFVFFMLGLGGMVSSQFAVTANDYWMYKFRDPANETFDLRNKTYMQANFQSFNGMASMVPSICVTILLTFFGHKVNVKFRFYGTLIIMNATFLIDLIFVGINTDSWQSGFFALTIMNGAFGGMSGTALGMTTMTLFAKFPSIYIKFYTFGSAAAGITSAILQVICKAIGGGYQHVALIFFSLGLALQFLTLVLAVIVQKNTLYIYYSGDTVVDTKKPIPKYKDMKELVVRTWPFLIGLFLTLPMLSIGYPYITTLIVSEGYGHGNVWNDDYFGTVITMLLYNVLTLVGGIIATPVLTQNNKIWWVILTTLKSYIGNPLFLFCNAQPKSGRTLPVWFPHDYEYVIVLTVNTVADSYIRTASMLSMGAIAGDMSELGFVVLQAIGRIVFAMGSAFSSFWVSLL